MAIFANTQEAQTPTEGGPKILFLHGLEGSPQGAKSAHLKKRWGAYTPHLRTDLLREIRANHPSTFWQEMPKRQFKKAFSAVYEDAEAAMSYLNPDVIVGSSMGGSLLAKLILDGKWSGPSVFLAPAIDPLLGRVALPEMKNAVWILSEVDDVVPNLPNMQHCMQTRGNLVLSVGDSHRLQGALTSGLIDCAIVTSLELGNLTD